jgi:hypothetical protein
MPPERMASDTHCNVGTMPLTPAPAPGVAAGVAGVALLAADPAPACCPFCWPLCNPLASFSEDGGVKSPAPPGKDNDAGEVKALACCAVDGCVVSESMLRRTWSRSRMEGLKMVRWQQSVEEQEKLC